VDGVKGTGQIQFKVFASDGKDFEVLKFPAPTGKQKQLLTERLKMSLVEALRESFPGQIFRMVRVSARRYNVMHEPCPHLWADNICEYCDMVKPEPLVTIN
jgi:hypothetical protein